MAHTYAIDKNWDFLAKILEKLAETEEDFKVVLLGI